jgi:hypothetical protein
MVPHRHEGRFIRIGLITGEWMQTLRFVREFERICLHFFAVIIRKYGKSEDGASQLIGGWSTREEWTTVYRIDCLWCAAWLCGL